MGRTTTFPLVGALLGALTLAGAGCSTADASPNPRGEEARRAGAHVEQVSGTRARQLVDEGAQLVDVRTPREFASGHPAPARNIPVDQIGARLAELDRARPVVVYCHSGRRSAAAAEVLTAAGFTVYDMGSASSWR
jgi:rhodanese-related sulfurtransferase